MTHVLIIVQNLPVPLDRRVWLEATSLLQAGYRVSVIAPAEKSQPWREVLDGIRVLRYPPPPEARSTAGFMFEFAYCWLCTAMLALPLFIRDRYQVLQACNPPETFFVLALLLRPFGVRFVFDHHDLSPEMYLAKGGRSGGFLHRALLWFERQTFEASDVVMTTNESHAAVARGRGGVPADRVVVVRNGPDTRRLVVRAPAAELRDGRRYLVGYLGEMCVQDGVDHLLLAARHIVHDLSRRDVSFILVGGGPELASLQALALDLEIGACVKFTGRVPDDELCRVLSTVDVCVDPDPLTEWSTRSTMNKMMEYMFFGKAIVGYPLEENRRSAEDAALYVAPNDPEALARGILLLLDSEVERERRGAIGFERVRARLMWEHSVPLLLDAYRKV